MLHLNGYKIANPTISGENSPEELESLFIGYGWTPYVVEGDDPEVMHQKMAQVAEQCVQEIRAIQQRARSAAPGVEPERPRWPMIILRTPKGWTGPKELDGHKAGGLVAGAPDADTGSGQNPAHLKLVEAWLRSYKPEELFDENGTLIAELKEMAPRGA